MKKVQVIIIALGLVVLPLFQNCGMDSANKQTGGLFVGEATPDCLSTVVDCGPKPEFLEITIDLTNPSVFAHSNSTFVVYGRCNEGNYEITGIRYVVYAATNLENPISEVTVTNTGNNGHCQGGKYYRAIDISGLARNTAYVLEVQMIGYDPETGLPVQNLQANGSANMDFSKD